VVVEEVVVEENHESNVLMCARHNPPANSRTTTVTRSGDGRLSGWFGVSGLFVSNRQSIPPTVPAGSKPQVGDPIIYCDH